MQGVSAESDRGLGSPLWRELALAALLTSSLLAICWASGLFSVGPATGTSFDPDGLQTRRLPPRFSDDESPVEETFQIVNRQSRLVKVTAVNSSCTCTDARVNKTELHPGEAAKLVMKAHLAGRDGLVYLTSSIHFDSGPSAECRVIVPMHKRYEFTPDAIFFGVVERAAMPQRATALVSRAARREELLTPELSADDPRSVRLIVGAPTDVKSPFGFWERRIPVQARLLSRNGAGPATTYVRLGTAATGLSDIFDTPALRLSWTAASVYRAEPARLFFNRVERDARQRPAGKISLRRDDGKRFRAPAFTAPDFVVVRRVSAETGERAEFDVQIRDTSRRSAVLSGEIVFALDTPDVRHSILEVPVTALMSRSK